MPTLPRIDYRIEKYQLTEASETPKIAAQWQQVLNTCQQQKAGSTERLRIALQTVDYVTSFELPFRLMLIRAPQLIDKLREDGGIFSKSAKINGNKRCVVYSRHADFLAPEDFHYRRTYKVFRTSAEGGTTSSYTSIAQQSDIPRERLRLALASGLLVTALDAMLFFGIQRVAVDVMALRKQGLDVTLSQADVFDSQTQTRREIPAYWAAH